MQEQEIKNYVLAQSEIEFPAFQKAFSLSYSEAKSIIADLEKCRVIQFKSGVVYSVLSQPSEPAPSYYEPKTDFEAKCINALWVCVNEGTANASLIQRKCQIGYLLAMKVVEWMEKNNYISHYPNRVPLISKEDYINKFGKPEGYNDDEAVDVDKEIAEFMRNLENNGDDNSEDNDEPDVPDVNSVLSENISRQIKRTPSGKYVLDLNGKFDIWFEYLHESNVMRLSDDGAVYIFAPLSDRRIKNAIKKFAQVQYADERVFIDVPKPADTFKAVLTLYSALDYLFKLT